MFKSFQALSFCILCLSSWAYGGFVQFSAVNIQNFSMLYSSAIPPAPYSSNPDHYCTALVDKSHYVDHQNQAFCLGNTPGYPSILGYIHIEVLDKINKNFRTMQTYILPFISIYQVNGQAAPISCLHLDQYGYDYRNNHNYNITISSSGCSVRDLD